MDTIEVGKQDWMGFLNEFSRQHEGGYATLEIIGEDTGVQSEGQPRAFVGISAEKSGQSIESISVMLGLDAEEHLEHHIYGAEHLRLKTTEGGARDALEIEAADGTRTILALQTVPLLA